MTSTNPDPSLPTLAPTTENTVLNWFVGRYVCRHVEESAKPNGECKTKQSSGNLTTVLTALHLARAPKFRDLCMGGTFPFHHVLEDRNLFRIEHMT